LFFEKPTHYNLAYNGKYFSLRIFNPCTLYDQIA